MDKHMIAAVIMRKAMQKAERIFKPALNFLNKKDLECMLEQFEKEFNEEILNLLDQVLDLGWV